MGRDIYSKITQIVSIDQLTPELLHKLIVCFDTDEKLEQKKDAIEFAMSFLDENEIELMFFRYFQGNSYKTLKKTMDFGSTKTAAKRLRKLNVALKAYVMYYLSEDTNYEADIALIKQELGSDAAKVADALFRRNSKNAIAAKKEIQISQVRLAKTIRSIALLCQEKIQLEAYWKFITTAGKVSKKIV